MGTEVVHAKAVKNVLFCKDGTASSTDQYSIFMLGNALEPFLFWKGMGLVSPMRTSHGT